MNTNRPTTFDLNEAALLAEMNPEEVRRELKVGILPRRRDSKGNRLAFEFREIAYLYALHAVPFPLPEGEKREIFAVLVERAESSRGWHRGASELLFSSREGPFKAEVYFGAFLRRVLAMWRGRRRVRVDPAVMSGEPVFEGTRIPVRDVGMKLKRGAAREEILRDFPALSPADLDFARMFAEMPRPPGRPSRLRFVRE